MMKFSEFVNHKVELKKFFSVELTPLSDNNLDHPKAIAQSNQIGMKVCIQSIIELFSILLSFFKNVLRKVIISLQYIYSLPLFMTYVCSPQIINRLSDFKYSLQRFLSLIRVEIITC